MQPVRRTRHFGWLSIGLPLAFAIVLCASCSGPDPLEVRVLECASLPGASSSANEELARQVALLRESNYTPDSWHRLPIPPSANAAVALEKTLVERLTPRIEEKVDSFFREDRWLDDPDTIDSIESFLNFHTKLIGELESAASKEHCAFDCQLEYGFFANLNFLAQAEFAVRVQLLQAVHAGRYGETKLAGEALSQALLWSEWLTHARRLEPRLLGAVLRNETLDIAGLMFVGGWLGREEAEMLYPQLRSQLADWPYDSKALVGDRTVTMHTYEVLRKGMIDMVLTGRETAALHEAGRLAELQNANQTELDQDELNYLYAMQRLIDIPADTPLYLRQESIEEARSLAAQAPDLFANEVFLNEIPSALSLMARDRALCEGWCIVLAQSVGFEIPPFRVNPANGEEYQEMREEGNVRVSLRDPALTDPICPDF